MGCQTTTAIDACGATNTMGIRACGQTALQRTWSLEQLPIVMMLDSRRMSWQRAWKTTRTPVRRGYMLLPLSLLWCSWDDCWAKCCPMRHHGLNPSSFHDHRLALSNPCVISDLGGRGACLFEELDDLDVLVLAIDRRPFVADELSLVDDCATRWR